MSSWWSRPRSATQAGFTLIEVLVAIAMLGVVAAAIFSAFAVVSELNRDAARDQEATVAARSYLEDVRAAWSTPDDFDLAVAPAPPVGCTVTLEPSVPSGEVVRTVSLACDAVQDAFVVVLGRPRATP